MDNSRLQFIDSSDRRATVTVDSENVFITAEQDSEPNPWLSSTFSSNSTNKNSGPEGSSESYSSPSPLRTAAFPRPNSDSDFARQQQSQSKFRNGKANLNVFNPPQMPPFGDRGSATDTNSTESGYGSDSGSSGSESDQFLSFPIPIFNPDIPYAAPSAITNVLVRLPGSLSMSPGNRNRNRNGSGSAATAPESELESLPILTQEHERTSSLSSSSSSYRSSVNVYDGCRSIPQAAGTGVSSRSPSYWQTPVSSPISSPLQQVRQDPQAFLHQTQAVEMRYPTPTPTRVNSPTIQGQGENLKKKRGRRLTLKLGF